MSCLCVQAAPFPVWLLAFVAWQCLDQKTFPEGLVFAPSWNKTPRGRLQRILQKLDMKFATFSFLVSSLHYAIYCFKKSSWWHFWGLFQSFTSEPFHPKTSEPLQNTTSTTTICRVSARSSRQSSIFGKCPWGYKLIITCRSTSQEKATTMFACRYVLICIFAFKTCNDMHMWYVYRIFCIWTLKFLV